jgi:predicted GIY-YIG superfamily endonuclease
MYTVYALCDPLTEPECKDCQKPSWNCYYTWKFSLARRVRYIGITDDIYRRFSQHLSCSDKRNLKKNNWITVRKNQQEMIQLEILQQVESAKVAQIRETFWIAYYHYLGADLLNLQKYGWLPGSDMVEFLRRAYRTGSFDRLNLDLMKMRCIWEEVRNDEFHYASRDRVRELEEKMGRKDPWLAGAIERRESLLSWDELYDQPAKERAIRRIKQRGKPLPDYSSWYAEAERTQPHGNT